MRRALTIGAFFHDLVEVAWPCFSPYCDESCTGCRPGDNPSHDFMCNTASMGVFMTLN